MKLNTLSRKRIAELLDLPTRAKTYEVLPADKWGDSIPEPELVAWLNWNRVGDQPDLTIVPQLVSDRRIVREARITRDGKPLTLRRLHAMCKRTRFPVPHYRLSSRRYAFRSDAFDWWQKQIGSGSYVNQRHYEPSR